MGIWKAENVNGLSGTCPFTSEYYRFLGFRVLGFRVLGC